MYNYESFCDEDFGNIDENEYDQGWGFPVSQDEVGEQLMDINERIDREDEFFEVDFWCWRPSLWEEEGTSIAEEDTENEVEASDEDDQERTEEGEGEGESDED